MKNTRKLLGFYVHIPFCVQKCRYCDFLSFAEDKEAHEAYIEALCREIVCLPEKYEGFEPADTQTDTIYIGGGTPSILEPAWMERVLCKLKDSTNLSAQAEITIEANPGTLTREKLQAYRAMGINRLSIGLQSADNAELKLLGRIHTWEEFLANYELAREAGFENINVDLMTALPGQTVERLAATLEQVLRLKPEHISAYSLILEEGTPFYEAYAGSSVCTKSSSCTEERLPQLPTEETERSMYYLTRDILTAHGYHHYEISNFAKPGYESRHNSSYWNGTDYLGVGLGASSLFAHTRYRNAVKLTDYEKSPLGFLEQITLDRAAQTEEFMFLGLRLLDGICKSAFEQKFQTTLEQEYGAELEKLKREGLLCENNGKIALTERGIDYGNYVFSAFLKER